MAADVRPASKFDKSEPITIGIVEDHPIFARAVADHIATQQPRMRCVGVTSTPEDAYCLAAEHTPDVMLVDLALQGEIERGLELVACLVDAFGSTKVVVLTAYDHDEVLFSALKAGAIGFLHKEKVDDRSLIGHIERAYLEDIAFSPGIAERVIQYFRGRTAIGEWGYEGERTLTPREKEVLELAASGLSNKEIAERLGISWRTVKVHISNVLGKLRLESRYELWLYRMQAQLGGPIPGNRSHDG